MSAIQKGEKLLCMECQYRKECLFYQNYLHIMRDGGVSPDQMCPAGEIIHNIRKTFMHFDITLTVKFCEECPFRREWEERNGDDIYGWCEHPRSLSDGNNPRGVPIRQIRSNLNFPEWCPLTEIIVVKKK